MRSEQLVRPGLTVLERTVSAARMDAERATHLALEPVLDGGLVPRLEALLIPDVELSKDGRAMTRLAWLAQEGKAGSRGVLGQIAKVVYLRGMGADGWDLSGVNPNRRRYLAQLARRSTNQALQRRPERVRHPALVAFCADQAAKVTDEVVDLFDEAIATAHGRARRRLLEKKLETATSQNEKVRLLAELLEIVLDRTIPDAGVRTAIWEREPPEVLAQVAADAKRIARPADDNHYPQLEDSYSHVRTFAPRVLEVLSFSASPAARELLDAVELLRDLNRSGRRTVPAGAPVSFAPASWRKLIVADGGLDRHHWELCVLSELRLALRSGDIWVRGSRRYQPIDSYLIPRHEWDRRRQELAEELEKPLDFQDRRRALERDLGAEVAALERALSEDQQVEIDEDGQLRLLDPEEDEEPPVPEETPIGRILTPRITDVDIPDLLVDMNHPSGFMRFFTHAAGGETRTPEIERHIYATLIAHACNHPFSRMAKACGLTKAKLDYADHWYFREETLVPANAAIVDFIFNHPLAQLIGDGSFSSSDGRRVQVTARRSQHARALPRYFGLGHGVTFYTWTSDQHSHYASRVVRTSLRDATYVLDGILDNQTELPISKHTTDTAGYSDLIFGLFDLLELDFCPHLAGLPDRRLYHVPEMRSDTAAGRLLDHPINTQLIAEYWDELLRIAASIKHGHVTASLLVQRLQAHPNRSQLARALQEYGRIIKTRFILRYHTRPEEREAIRRQLNKHESMHALHDFLFYGNDGKLRLATLDRQSVRAACLHLVANAIVAWNLVAAHHALDQLEAEGKLVPPELQRQFSPTLNAHINKIGKFDIDPNGGSPLRDLIQCGELAAVASFH
jgi:TnpA family transposase